MCSDTAICSLSDQMKEKLEYLHVDLSYIVYILEVYSAQTSRLPAEVGSYNPRAAHQWEQTTAGEAEVLSAVSKRKYFQMAHCVLIHKGIYAFSIPK